jgi:hypothetical protein
LPKNKKARAESHKQANGKGKIKPFTLKAAQAGTSKAGKALSTVQAKCRLSVEVEDVPDEGDHIVKPKAGKAMASAAQATKHHLSIEVEDAPDEGDHIIKQASDVVVTDVDTDSLDVSDMETELETTEESCEAELGKKQFHKVF